MKLGIVLVIILVVAFIVISRKKSSTEAPVSRITGNELQSHVSSLIEMLTGSEDSALTSDIVLAYSNPSEYVKNNPAIFSDYGIESVPDENYRDIALIVLFEQLDSKGLAFGFDWKEIKDNVEAGINILLKNGAIAVELPQVDDTTETLNVIKLYDSTLNEYGYSLVELGRGNDSYEIILVKSDIAGRLISCSEALGFKLEPVAKMN